MTSAPTPAPAGRPRGEQAADDHLDVLLGEVSTTLLQNSCRVGTATVAALLDLVPGGRVRTATRPVAHALSPDLTVGVHCPLATRSGTRVDGAGTAVARTSVVGGAVLQSSVRARLTRAATEHRLPWSHYVANPGVIEVVGRGGAEDLAQGFLTPSTRTSLDLGAIGNRVLNRVQRMPHIDRVTLLRARRTKLRFAVTWRPSDAPPVQQSPRGAPPDQDCGMAFEKPSAPVSPGSSAAAAAAAPGAVEFVVHDESLRTLRLRVPECDPADVVAACEDLAFHDWLLSTVMYLLENSRIGVDLPGEVVQRIRPVIDNLLHLWMPGSRVPEHLAEIWVALERHPGFSRQWSSLVGQIRDQMALAVFTTSAADPPQRRGVVRPERGVEGLFRGG